MQRSNTKRALVVEDYQDLRRMLRVALERAGYEVTEAKDGREALEIYEGAMQAGENFDLAIVDYYMPHYKGDTVIEGLKAKAGMRGQKPPVTAMLTGSKDGDLVARARSAGLGMLFIKGNDNDISDLMDWIIGGRQTAHHHSEKG